jgi:hypothetical protein
MLVVLRTYDNYISANLVLGRLQEAGFHAFLRDEHSATVDPFLLNSINGIKLVVPEEEAKAVSAVLGVMEDEYKENE